MDVKAEMGCSSKANSFQSDEEMAESDLRRGPWTVDEDLTLINYIAIHGEGRWNSLARSAGLKRTGKSCRLRWLNYLRPDVKRGNITLEEQLLILELHSRWGNRWSKIAQYLPGRTDNEIKNYWRTRVQKHAKQLKCDVNSKQFKDTMRYLWMPRLVERIQAAAAATADSSTTATATAATNSPTPSTITTNNTVLPNTTVIHNNDFVGGASTYVTQSYTPENSSNAASSDSFGTQVSDFTADYYSVPAVNNNSSNPEYVQANHEVNYLDFGSLTSPLGGGFFNHGWELQGLEQNMNQWWNHGNMSENIWNVEDMILQ